MSQRNPMNERYTSEAKRGSTRKSAASAKPKSQAASSVTVGSKKKTPAERKAMAKAARKAEQQRQRELDRKYYKPDTERYKKLRRTWWMALIGAVICVCASWALRGVQPDWLALVALFLAYGLIIFAFYLDFSKIRKERRAYQERMAAQDAAAEREAKRSGKKPAKDADKGEEDASGDGDGAGGEADAAEQKPKKPASKRGAGLRRKKAQEAEQAKLAAEKAAEADDSDGGDEGTDNKGK